MMIHCHVFHEKLVHSVSLAVLPYELLDWIIASWLFAIGGTVGSFLNVVVYRLPAGMSLVQPGSHCPVCKHPIRWFDNIPIFGWLALRGRCRDCGVWISPRYPIVEAITASVFLVLGVVECLGEATNLPGYVEDPWLRYGIYALHLLLLCTLLATALIQLDGHPVPKKLIWPVLVAGFVAPMVWPRLRPVPASWTVLQGWMAGLVDGLGGAAAGLVFGLLVAHFCEKKQRPGMVLATTCVGLVLGWQAAIGTIAASVALHLVARGVGRLFGRTRWIPPTTWLALVTLGWILCWSRLLAVGSTAMASEIIWAYVG